MNFITLTQNFMYVLAMAYIRDIKREKISAIKLDRSISGRGLKDSKDYIESLESFDLLNDNNTVYVSSLELENYIEMLRAISSALTNSTSDVQYLKNQIETLTYDVKYARDAADNFRSEMFAAQTANNIITEQLNALNVKYDQALRLIALMYIDKHFGKSANNDYDSANDWEGNNPFA